MSYYLEHAAACRLYYLCATLPKCHCRAKKKKWEDKIQNKYIAITQRCVSGVIKHTPWKINVVWYQHSPVILSQILWSQWKALLVLPLNFYGSNVSGGISNWKLQFSNIQQQSELHLYLLHFFFFSTLKPRSKYIQADEH